MAALPSERNAILLVDAYAVTTGLIALQQLKAVTGRYDEIIKTTGGVEQFQFPLDDPPQLARDPPSRARISFAKQVCRGLVSKRVNHTPYILHE
jgi:hypothetical protein